MTFDVIDFGLPEAYCLLFAIYVVIAIRRVQRGNGLGKSLAIVTIAGTVLTAAAFVVPGLPNIADRIRERTPSGTAASLSNRERHMAHLSLQRAEGIVRVGFR